MRSAVPARDIEQTACTRCGVSLGFESARFAAGMGITQCALCRMAPPDFDLAVSAADYTSGLREMLRQLKYDKLRAIAESILGQHLARAIATLPLDDSSFVLLVPVPLFAARQRERGYNQAALLATSACRHLRRLRPHWKLELAPQLLKRVKDTRAMHTLQPHHRRASLAGAFRAIDKLHIAGRDILLVDDIMTTGATARECSKVLRAAGASRIWVATVARAQPEFLAPSTGTARWTQPPASTNVVHPRSERQHRFS